MAPESESQPVAGPSSTSASDAVASSSSTTLDSIPKSSNPPHRRRQSSRESSRPRKAVFHLDEGDAPTEANTPGSSSRSRDSSASMMSPVFDVRASFAPMVFNKRPAAAIPTTTTAAARTALDPSSSAHQRSVQSDVTAVAASSSTAALSAAAASHPPNSSSSSKRPHSNLHHIEDDGAGLEYAGRKWKGKTAHAVEQELEQEGDTTIMSYSPDAVYLASRLEGLRRNLEAAGDEARGRKWIGWTAEEEEEEVVEELDKTTLSSRGSPVERSAAISPMIISPPVQEQESSQFKDQAPASIPVIREDRQPATLPTHVSDLIPRPWPPAVKFVPPRLDPQAKAAALDSRVELRLLRRSDLEQVRELHCLHGDDNEKVDAEHYATSAAFLLRLLVDENHVCVVAVAKPLPIPEQPFMTDNPKLHGHHHHHRHNLSPRPPPPSMDMPPSSAAYVFASQGLTSDSPLLQPIDFKDKAETRGRRKSGRGPASSLGRHSPILGAMSEEEDSEEDAAADSSLDLDEEGDVGSDVADQDEDEEAELSDSASLLGTSPAAPQRSQSLAVPSALHGRASSGALRVGSSSSSSSISRLSPLAAAASTEPSQPSSLSSSLAGSGVPAPRTYTTMPTTTVADSPTLEDSSSHQHPSHLIPLAGPTNEVAPPRALRVMIPPPPGVTLERETILGVASASISIKPATESLWGWEADSSAKRPKKEIHILTLAVSSAERGLGLGGRLLDRVIEEGKVRSVGSAYRAQMGRRVGRSGSIPPPLSSSTDLEQTTAEDSSQFTQTRTYLEVHPSSLHAQSLYLHRGFKQVRRLHGFYRGDPRIPARDRSLPGGGDALLFEREEEVEEEEKGEVK